MAPDLDRPARTLFTERLWPSIAVWCGVVVMAGMFTVTFAPIRLPLALGAGAAVLVTGVVVAIRTSPRVEVAHGELRAGGAHIPVGVLGAARSLDRAQMRVELGPALDARAYVCLRAWIGTGVRVEVLDPQDPTPYWLVSTRHPLELLAALDGTARTDA
jgi:hypothetical protein